MPTYTEDDYSADELRDAARQRGLNVTGTKAELVERLNDYEDNPPDHMAAAASPVDQDDYGVGTDAQETDTVDDGYLTGAQKRAKELDARREAERVDASTGGVTEMERWHQIYGEEAKNVPESGEA